MSKELVIQSLKNVNMAFCCELAGMSELTREQTIAALLDLEKDGYAAQRNGYWWLTVSGNEL